MDLISDDLLRRLMRSLRRDLSQLSMLSRRVRSACKRVVVTLDLDHGDGCFIPPFEFTALRCIRIHCRLGDDHYELLRVATATCARLRMVDIFPGPILPQDVIRALAAVGSWPKHLALHDLDAHAHGVVHVSRYSGHVTDIEARRVLPWDRTVAEVLQACPDTQMLDVGYAHKGSFVITHALLQLRNLRLENVGALPSLTDLPRLTHLFLKGNAAQEITIPQTIFSLHIDGVVPHGLVIPASVGVLELLSTESFEPEIVIHSCRIFGLMLRDVRVQGGFQAWLGKSRDLGRLWYSQAGATPAEVARAAAQTGAQEITLAESARGPSQALAVAQVALYEQGAIHNIWGTGMTATLPKNGTCDLCGVLLSRCHEVAIT